MKVIVEQIRRLVTVPYIYQRVDFGTYDMDPSLFATLNSNNQELWFGLDGEGDRKRYTVAALRPAAIESIENTIGVAIDIIDDEVRQEICDWIVANGDALGAYWKELGGELPDEPRAYRAWAEKHGVWP